MEGKWNRGKAVVGEAQESGCAASVAQGVDGRGFAQGVGADI